MSVFKVHGTNVCNRRYGLCHPRSLFLHEGDSSYYIAFVSVSEKRKDIGIVINALRLAKNSKVGIWFPITVNDNGGMIASALFYPRYQSTPYQEEIPVLTVLDKDTDEIDSLINAQTDKSYDPIVDQMIQFFNNAIAVEDSELRFILRITILEMIVDGNAELSHRISRYIGVLLGKSKEESAEIAKTVKEMYNARSKYLHEGRKDKINPLMRMNALDYSRRVIANIMLQSDSIKDIRTTLEQSGYGENPYRVMF